MNLDRENMKKLMLLITFTVVLLVGVQRLDVVLGTLNVIWTIFLPFVLGSAIAFFLNVPMAFLEKKLFGRREEEKKNGLARPLSLLLTVVIVIAVIVFVIFVVVPVSVLSSDCPALSPAQSIRYNALQASDGWWNLPLQLPSDHLYVSRGHVFQPRHPWY